jgi:cytochrome P450
MANMPAPAVEFPLPKSPVPFEPAPELLALSRQAPVLRTVLPGNHPAWLVTGFAQVREVLVDPPFSRAQVSSPGRERRGLEDLDITRPAGAHIGFGVGAHHCLGAQLARVELAEAFRGLLGRLPGLRLAVDPSELRFKEKMTITSLEELPVTWDS